MKTIEVFIRSDGNQGYIVGWRTLSGHPIELRRYPAGSEGRAQAAAHKTGMIDGMRALVNVTESLIG